MASREECLGADATPLTGTERADLAGVTEEEEVDGPCCPGCGRGVILAARRAAFRAGSGAEGNLDDDESLPLMRAVRMAPSVLSLLYCFVKSAHV